MRLGADETVIVYGRDRAHMMARKFETDDAAAEGVTFKWLSSITEIVGAATPVVTPISLGVKNNTLGTRP